MRDIDPEGWGWGVTEHLMAAAVEQLDAGNRMFVMAHSKKGTQSPEPVFIPRPGVTKEPATSEEGPRMSSKEEMKAFFNRAG